MTVITQTKREKLAAREDAIVSAATTAFLAGGLRSARMAEIARAADVAEGTLYLYFKNKEALFAAVVARHWRDLKVGADEAISGHDDPYAQLTKLGRFTLQRIYGDWKLFELTFALHYAANTEEDMSDRRGYVRVFDRVIERGIDRGLFAPQVPGARLRDLFFGTMEYAVRSILARQEPEDALDGALETVMAAMRGVLMIEGQPKSEEALADRLEAAIDRLEAMGS